MERSELIKWRDEIELELKENILSFWMKHSVDEKNGGFVGAITNDLAIVAEADKSLVLNARILWTFASAYRLYNDPSYFQIADRAYEYLIQYFWDEQYGGFYWMLNSTGEPIQTKKQIYGQAFVIYAITEYIRARPNQKALHQAIILFENMERYSYDGTYKGYVEALGRNWEETDDLSLSGTDLNEKKSMNTHLHVLEAYTNLFRVWQSDVLKGKLQQLIEVTIEHIVDKETNHFLLFFDEKWEIKSHEISYGHDIEGSWLLMEAAEVLGNEQLLHRCEEIALAMAQSTYEEGLDADGAVINEADPNGWTDTDKHWWPQAEAVIGFLNAYQMSGEDRYLQAAYQAWRFIDEYIVDKNNGEWFWKVDQAGKPSNDLLKVDSWKCPYHNGRMGFEAIERLERIANSQ